MIGTQLVKICGVRAEFEVNGIENVGPYLFINVVSFITNDTKTQQPIS